MIRSRPRREKSAESHWVRRLELQRERRRSMKFALVLLIGVPAMLIAILLLVRAGLMRKLEEHESSKKYRLKPTPDWRSMLPVPPTQAPPPQAESLTESPQQTP